MKAPFDLPAGGVSRQSFELERVDYLTPEASGRIGGVQAGQPLWSTAYTLTEMLPSKSDEWRTFLSRLRGVTRRFLGYDRKRPFPKAYPAGFAGMTRAGGGSFDGTATSWSESIAADGDSTITLNGLPAGFVLSPIDYIGFRWTATEPGVAGLTWHAPVRVVVGGTASGGGSIAVTCEPAVPLAVPPGATAYLDHPKAVFAIASDQSKLEPFDRRGAIRGGALVGVQDLRS